MAAKKGTRKSKKVKDLQPRPTTGRKVKGGSLPQNPVGRLRESVKKVIPLD